MERWEPWPRRWLSGLGLAAAVGMFVVLVMGATVTTTGSAQGCGRDWPLCHGRFVPDFAVSTLIEFSHRAVTGLESILVVALAATALAVHRRGPIRLLAPLMLGTLILQALLGAWAVKYPQQPEVLALHFGVSLLALAATALTAVYVRRPAAIRSAPAVGPGIRRLTWANAGYLYLLVYSGAYIRHTGAAAACPSWPLCGAGTPAPSVALAIDLAHRLAAAAALGLALILVAAYRRRAAARPDLVAGGWALVGILVAQGGSGALLVLSHFGLFGELLHAAVTGLTFGVAAYLCLRVSVGSPRPEVATVPAAPPLARGVFRQPPA